MLNVSDMLGGHTILFAVVLQTRDVVHYFFKINFNASCMLLVCIPSAV